VAVIYSVIGAYYYLRVNKLMYYDRAEDDAPLSSPVDMNAVMSVNGLAVLALGIYPSALMALCTTVMT
jgi:NADH-quinone oxidoreductase subunit N